MLSSKYTGLKLVKQENTGDDFRRNVTSAIIAKLVENDGNLFTGDFKEAIKSCTSKDVFVVKLFNKDTTHMYGWWATCGQYLEYEFGTQKFICFLCN